MATTYTARYWDKTSAINGCPADKALASFGLADSQKLGILSADGRDCITKVFPVSATDTDLNAWRDETNTQAAEQEQVAQQEQKRTADLTAQVAALGQQVATLTAQNAALGKQVATLSAGKASE